MLRWFGPRKATEPPDLNNIINSHHHLDDIITDDPLAAIHPNSKLGNGGGVGGGGKNSNHKPRQIYSVSRSVILPRVTLKNTSTTTNSATTINGGGVEAGGDGFFDGINPIFQDISTKQLENRRSRQSSPLSVDKSTSSGYGGSPRGSHGGSSLDPLYLEQLQLKSELLEQNAAYVKSIKISPNSVKKQRSGSSSSTGGTLTLTTIPEGKVDQIPEPIWPLDDGQYDSLVDDALLLYTSLNYHPEKAQCLESLIDMSVKDLLLELLNGINATLEGRSGAGPEEMLRIVNEKIRQKLDCLRNATEDEMRRLCINLSNSQKLSSVIRAFNNSRQSSPSSSGNSSQTEWGSGRVRTSSNEIEDIYHQIPSTRSSSSGFSSDSLKDQTTSTSTTKNNINKNNNPINKDNSGTDLPVFVHEDIVSVPNGIRNALIYGTLYRKAHSHSNNKCDSAHIPLNNSDKTGVTDKGVPKTKSLLRAVNDNKPSVWEQYYGVRAQQVLEEGAEIRYVRKPTDVPLFPGGRPEADFTLDLPRSELLSKKMRDDKKWRCRCRLLTSFLGLVFFLLSVMAVSLMLTRGKRMFGSMV